MEDRVTFGLDRKMAYGLIFLFGWISGLIFYFSEKTDYKVKHKAMQAIVAGATYSILMILSRLPLVGWIIGMVGGLLAIVVFIIAILSFTGKDIDIPVISEIAINFVK